MVICLKTHLSCEQSTLFVQTVSLKILRQIRYDMERVCMCVCVPVAYNKSFEFENITLLNY